MQIKIKGKKKEIRMADKSWEDEAWVDVRQE